MCQTAIVLIVIGSIALCLATTGFLVMLSKLDNMTDLHNRLRDKCAQTEALCRKLEAVAMWFLDRKGMTLENTGSWVTPWLVVAKKDPNEQSTLADAWAAAYAHREELAQALLDALRQWDKEREANWAEKTKGKKK